MLDFEFIVNDDLILLLFNNSYASLRILNLHSQLLNSLLFKNFSDLSNGEFVRNLPRNSLLRISMSFTSQLI